MDFHSAKIVSLLEIISEPKEFRENFLNQYCEGYILGIDQEEANRTAASKATPPTHNLLDRMPSMTRQNEKPEIARRLVIFSDICSSTTILEDLKASDDLGSWVNVLINLKENFIHLGSKKGIEMHKFIGDGWVLLSSHNIAQEVLFDFLGHVLVHV